MKMNIGELIRSERIKRGWTQEDLAEKIHSTSKTIQRIETGKTKPRLSTRTALAVVLGIPSDAVEAKEDLEAPEEISPVFPRVLIHLSALIPFIILTSLIWLWLKSRHPSLKSEVMQVINFQINVWAVIIPCGFFAVFFIPVLILMAMGIFTWVMVGINVVRVLMGETPQYPAGMEVFKDRQES